MNSKNNILPQKRIINMIGRTSARLCAALWLTLVLFACSSQKPALTEIPVERDGTVIAVVKAEIARTSEEHARGLMYRDKLPDGEGMLFIFEKDDLLSF